LRNNTKGSKGSKTH